jgi:Tle cognate immunity protein 4 C-terminal domain
VTLVSRQVVVLIAALVGAIGLFGLENDSRGGNLDKSVGLPDMRTHCVGRFLIDLPSALEKTSGGDVELIYGLDRNFRKVQVIEPVVGGSSSSFNGLIAGRVAELLKQTHFSSSSGNMLALRSTVRENVVLIRAYANADMTDAFKSELFAAVQAATAVVSTKVYSNDKPEDREASLLKVLEGTSYMATPDRAGKGTCLGSLLIDAKQDGEVFKLTFRSKTLKDVVVAVSMNSLVEKSDGGLLQRWDSKAGMLSKLNFSSSTLRRGKVTIAGRPGEELLSKGKEQGHVVRGFTAEVLRPKAATFGEPSFSIDMNMGGQVDSADYVDATWSDKEALAIWDAILKSIRPRPGAL